jgi:hypothetical protein
VRNLAVIPARQREGKVAPVRRRPDTTIAAFVGAFALGIVVAAVGLLALQDGHEATVPATEYQAAAERAAAAEATAKARLAALDDADALLRRLVAALDSPATLTTAERDALRSDVARQIERVEKVRVVRVPVPGPVVTVAPELTPARSQPRPATRQDRPSPTAAPTPACQLEVLRVCLAR